MLLTRRRNPPCRGVIRSQRIAPFSYLKSIGNLNTNFMVGRGAFVPYSPARLASTGPRAVASKHLLLLLIAIPVGQHPTAAEKSIRLAQVCLDRRRYSISAQQTSGSSGRPTTTARTQTTTTTTTTQQRRQKHRRARLACP